MRPSKCRLFQDPTGKSDCPRSFEISVNQAKIRKNLQFKKGIFDEKKIKNLKLKNRIIRGSVGEKFFCNGKILEEGYKFYEDLAKGEIGTIFTGYATVSDYDQFDSIKVFRIDKDEYIEQYKKLTSLVHKNNANIIMQLVHIGGKTTTNIERPYAPSEITDPTTKKLTRELSKDDILRIENDFVKAAIRAKKSGFDGIELHAAHSYLLSEFLSPAYNKRNDEYGGTNENRARIIIEIIEKIRKEVGNDYIISLKINCNDDMENGITEEGFLIASQLAVKAGVDLIQVSGNEWLNKKGSKKIFFIEETKKLAEIVNVPVVLIGGVRDVDTIEKILNESKIEYIGLARPLICEPDLVKKWKEGKSKKAKCVSCNGCLKNNFSCVFNKKK